MPLCSLLPPCSVPADGYLRQIIPPQGPFVKYFSPIPSSKASFRGVSPGLAGAPRKKQPTMHAGVPLQKHPTIRKNSLRSFLLMRACGNCVPARTSSPTTPFAKTLPSVAFLLMRACGNCVPAQATLPTTPFAKTLPVVVFLLMRACGNSVPAHPHSNKKPASVLESKLSGR